jgi:serine O-acetyltransferase
MLTRADIEKHGGARNLALWALAVYRFGRWSLEVGARARAAGGSRRGAPAIAWVTSKAYGAGALAVEIATGIAIHREARIGPDLFLPHAGNIMVHPEAVIGARVTIFHDVTIGTNAGREGAPTIADDVTIGPGARVLGPVTIGARATIAPNSLVVTDVPAGATVIGVPARVMPAAVTRAA